MGILLPHEEIRTMITYIEQKDVEVVAMEAAEEVEKEMEKYREGATRSDDIGNLIANGMFSAQRTFVLRLWTSGLISDGCYYHLTDTRYKC